MVANVWGMTGQPRTMAWAQKRVREAGGRPDRMAVWCLLLGRDVEAWRGMSRGEQEAALTPYVLEGERLHCSNDGELFIVPEATGGRGRSVVAERPLSELQAERAQQGMWANARSRLTREAMQEAYTAATIDMAAQYVQLEQTVLTKALAEDASPAERRLAMKAWESWKDRMMGKAVAPVEDVTPKGSSLGEWIAAERPATLPLSAGWTVESVAEEQRRELEAGTLEGDPG